MQPQTAAQPVRLQTPLETFFIGAAVGGLVTLLLMYGFIPALIESGVRRVAKSAVPRLVRD